VGRNNTKKNANEIHACGKRCKKKSKNKTQRRQAGEWGVRIADMHESRKTRLKGIIGGRNRGSDSRSMGEKLTDEFSTRPLSRSKGKNWVADEAEGQARKLWEGRHAVGGESEFVPIKREEEGIALNVKKRNLCWGWGVVWGFGWVGGFCVSIVLKLQELFRLSRSRLMKR